jgi:hypothetical protein
VHGDGDLADELRDVTVTIAGASAPVRAGPRATASPTGRASISAMRSAVQAAAASSPSLAYRRPADRDPPGGSGVADRHVARRWTIDRLARPAARAGAGATGRRRRRRDGAVAQLDPARLDDDARRAPAAAAARLGDVVRAALALA